MSARAIVIGDMYMTLRSVCVCVCLYIWRSAMSFASRRLVLAAKDMKASVVDSQNESDTRTTASTHSACWPARCVRDMRAHR